MLCVIVKRHVEKNVTERRMDTLVRPSNLCSTSARTCLVLAVLCATCCGLRETPHDATSPAFPIIHDAIWLKCRTSRRCPFASHRVIECAIFIVELGHPLMHNYEPNTHLYVHYCFQALRASGVWEGTLATNERRWTWLDTGEFEEPWSERVKLIYSSKWRHGDGNTFRCLSSLFAQHTRIRNQLPRLWMLQQLDRLSGFFENSVAFLPIVVPWLCRQMVCFTRERDQLL